jgi:crossover junction endodeoxyribonuclease RuvC
MRSAHTARSATSTPGIRVLGIDPGSRVTGFGVVERPAASERSSRDGGPPRALRHVAHGTLRPPDGLGLAERLAFLHAGIAEVIERHAPHQVVVEQVFVSNSARSALVLGQARGAVLAAAAGAGLDVHELTAREIKKAVVGTGTAAKGQVQAMVSRLLGLDRHPAQDAADALAAAVARVHADASAADGLGLRRGRARGRRRATGRFVLRGGS